MVIVLASVLGRFATGAPLEIGKDRFIGVETTAVLLLLGMDLPSFEAADTFGSLWSGRELEVFGRFGDVSAGWAALSVLCLDAMTGT